MENIEEHCEDDINDSESDMLVGKPSASQCFFQSEPAPQLSSSPGVAKKMCTSALSGQSCANDKVNGEDTAKATDAKLNVSKTLARFGTVPQIFTSASGSSGTRRMPHLHKLEKKHSSGDLHSRLKTRKLLGVGETDDGDIHRSKLSQILGHSDQLYIKLPYGLRLWQILMALMFTMTGLWALVRPSHIFQTTLDTNVDDMTSLPVRLYGGAVLSLSVVYWMTLNSQDRDIIRMCLLSSIVYFGIQFTVSVFSSTTMDSPVYTCFGNYAFVLWRCAQMLGSLYFYVILTRDLRHYR
ncbi:hypothetical protein BsWGS_08219 [Bradybaena similaris]